MVVNWFLPPLCTEMHWWCVTPLTRCAGHFWRAGAMAPPSAPSAPYSQKAGKYWVCMACNSALGALQKFRGAGKKPGSQGWDNLESGCTVLAWSLSTPVPGVSGGLSTIRLLMMQLIVVLLFLLRIIQSKAIPARTEIMLWWIWHRNVYFYCHSTKPHCAVLLKLLYMHVIKLKKKSWERRICEFWMSLGCYNHRIHLHYTHCECFQSWELFPS